MLQKFFWLFFFIFIMCPMGIFIKIFKLDLLKIKYTTDKRLSSLRPIKGDGDLLRDPIKTGKGTGDSPDTIYPLW